MVQGKCFTKHSCLLRNQKGTQTYSPMPLRGNQQKVYGPVFAKDNEKKERLKEG